jgi:hypothetical protein
MCASRAWLSVRTAPTAIFWSMKNVWWIVDPALISSRIIEFVQQSGLDVVAVLLTTPIGTMSWGCGPHDHLSFPAAIRPSVRCGPSRSRRRPQVGHLGPSHRSLE